MFAKIRSWFAKSETKCAEYSEGNTEMQDSMFFGKNGRLVDCVEVVPKEVIIVKYETVD